jgi:hypothetical protein
VIEFFKSALPFLSLVIAILAVVVGPLISMRISKKQNANNLRIANKQIIAPIRQSWVNELRVLLADITGKCSHYWASGYEYRTDAEYQYITETINKLNLYINPKEVSHLKLLVHVTEMHNALLSGSSTKSDAEFWNSHKLTIEQSQFVLKEEWERVKNEI